MWCGFLKMDSDGSNSISAWIYQNRLPSSLATSLVALGVEVVEDLDTLFQSDESLLQSVRDNLTSEQYDQFLTAYQKWNREEDDDASWSLIDGAPGVVNLKISGEDSAHESAGAETAKSRADRRHNQIEELDKRLKEAATLDLLIMLDCTGSMEPFITAAEEHIRDFVRSIGNVYPNIQLRLGFIGYRDHCDGEERLVVLPFSTDIAAFEGILALQAAKGGGDGPEDVLGALHAAGQLQWASAQRVLYHIGDYPCHGLHYHDNLPDDYPYGDPYGLQPRPLLQALAMLRVRYYFGILTGRTDRMLERFAEIMGPEFIEAAPMTSRNMIEVITATVTTLLTTSLSSSSSVENGTEEKQKDHAIVPDAPDWDAIKSELAVTFTLSVPATYTVLGAGDSGSVLDAFPDAAQVQIKCAPHPFAKGRNKLAFFAQQQLDEDNRALVRHIILKESLSGAKSHQTLEKFEKLVSCQRAALCLATEFNKVRPAGCAMIEFAPVRVLQFLARPGRPYFIEEDQIPGVWERYSNNTGWCATHPTPAGTDHTAVQAFSHWTHHITGGKIMITDCQGSYNKDYDCFLLTDPAVHSEEAIVQYEGTNMGKCGVERFFQSHQCNKFCTAMSLSSMK